MAQLRKSENRRHQRRQNALSTTIYVSKFDLDPAIALLNREQDLGRTYGRNDRLARKNAVHELRL
jgi:hypothetical protein